MRLTTVLLFVERAMIDARAGCQTLESSQRNVYSCREVDILPISLVNAFRKSFVVTSRIIAELNPDHRVKNGSRRKGSSGASALVDNHWRQ